MSDKDWMYLLISFFEPKVMALMSVLCLYKLIHSWNGKGLNLNC